MDRTLSILVAALALLWPVAGRPEANATALRIAREVCSKCHGQEGQSASSIVPHLAGQQVVYMDNQLRQFRNHGRSDPHAQSEMWGIAGPLSNSDIKALAQYFSGKPPPRPVPADAAQAAKGKAIATAGVEDRDIPACFSCHGPQAKGQGPIPRLAGQHRDYLLRQIKDFRASVREGATMHENAKAISDEEAEALAAFFASL